MGEAIGLELSFSLVAMCHAVVLVAMLIPISVGGLGVREGGFVLLLGQADVGAAQATLFSLLEAGSLVLASGLVYAVAATVEAVRGGGRGRESRTQPPRPSTAQDA